MRRTKIIATMGPSLKDQDSVEALVKAGVDVVRLNFSHGDAAKHRLRANLIRAAAKKLGKTVSILGDLQGPKIRIDKFLNGKKIKLTEGDYFVLDADMHPDKGTQYAVSTSYKNLPTDVYKDDELLLDDGNVVLKVTNIIGSKVHTVVTQGGILSNNKGINKKGGGLSAEALTQKDIKDIKLAVQLGVDYLAISFPRSAADLEYARNLMIQEGGDACIVAKIERAEAIEQPNLDDIISASDIIMIARGDLGVEIGDAELPAVQKMLIKRARTMDKAVITATQMMESMIQNAIPTRAEVFDVANAVMDGTDAVMLSAETAIGKNPARVVKRMAKICIEAEKTTCTKRSKHRVNVHKFKRIDESIAFSCMYAANHHPGIKGIAALTESGATTLWMSRISSHIIIYALTTHEKTCRRVNIYRGVHPVLLKTELKNYKVANKLAIDHLLSDKIVEKGDLVIVTKGDLMGKKGGTNMLKILRVGEPCW